MSSRTTRRGDHEAGHVGEVALRYAAHGWPVVPLHSPRGSGCSCPVNDCGSPGKHPRTRQGLHEATTDHDLIRAWWTAWPDANVAVVTGAASGLVVLDIDLPEGPASIARLQAEYHPLPSTCSQRTGSGGLQLLFAHPATTIRNRTALRPDLDVRGDGGYIVVPPSRHAAGERYQWIERKSPAQLPEWLVAVLTRADERVAASPRTPRRIDLPQGTREQRYATAAFEFELARVATAREGTRNDTLNRAAFSLGQLVAVGALDRDVVIDQLEHVATGTGLSPTEVRRTIASGLAAGVERPRELPVPPKPPTDERLASPPSVRRMSPRRL